jgi:hypothetical protein
MVDPCFGYLFLARFWALNTLRRIPTKSVARDRQNASATGVFIIHCGPHQMGATITIESKLMQRRACFNSDRRQTHQFATDMKYGETTTARRFTFGE